MPPASSAPGTWTATAQMVEARHYHTATLLLDGKVLVAGGVLTGAGDTAEPSASAELYDPISGSWSATGTMTEIRYSHTATLLFDGRVLVTSGWSSLIDPPPSLSAELYDPASGTWAATGMMITPRLSHTATLLADGRVLVTGGWREGDSLGPAEVYDPGSETWTTTAGALEVRWGHTATLLPDGRVLVVGGRGSGDAPALAELYDPRSGTWTATGEMIEARSNHTATLLPDGSVLIAGGESRTPPTGLASAEVFEPGSGTWTAARAMFEARSFHTATAMTDGTVLVTGNTWEHPSASAEWYEPLLGTWRAAPQMIVARSNHTATRLLDGRMLVVGDSGGQQPSAELYDPRGGS